MFCSSKKVRQSIKYPNSQEFIQVILRQWFAKVCLCQQFGNHLTQIPGVLGKYIIPFTGK